MHSIVTTFREAVIKVEVANFGAAIDTLIDQDANHNEATMPQDWAIAGSDQGLKVYKDSIDHPWA